MRGHIFGMFMMESTHSRKHYCVSQGKEPGDADSSPETCLTEQLHSHRLVNEVAALT